MMSMIKPRPMPPFPKVKIRPKNPRDRKLAKSAEKFLNWSLRRMPVQVGGKAGKSEKVFPRAYPWGRAPLRKRSAKKAYWHRLYILALKFLIRLDPLCRRCRRRHATEGHHPWGQIRALILLFFPICRVCHEEVEGNKNQARAEGWILYK